MVSVTTSSSLPSIRAISSLTHFLMTGRFTLVMSTFTVLNSGGNLVVRSRRLSTSVVSLLDILAVAALLELEARSWRR